VFDQLVEQTGQYVSETTIARSIGGDYLSLANMHSDKEKTEMKTETVNGWFVEHEASNAIIATNHLADDSNIPGMRYLMVCNAGVFEVWTRVDDTWRDLPVDLTDLEGLRGLAQHFWLTSW
jgi:hypothetical protein